MFLARAAASMSFVAAAILVSQCPVVAKPVVTVALTQAMVVKAPDGTIHLTAPDTSAPVAHGAVIRYTVTAKDVGTDPARRLVLIGPIPAPTAFVADSVRGPGGHAEFSLDGKSFAERPMVATTTPSGTTMTPADPSQYVMVRWIRDAPLEAGASTDFSYDVRVK